MRPGLSAMRLTQAAELDQLEAAWWELWRRCPGTTPFQSPAWLIPWWRAFAPGALCTIALHAGPRLAGLAPLYLEQAAEGARLLPLGIAASDYIDVLADPDHTASALASLGRCALNGPHWREWELPDIGPHALSRELPIPSGCTALRSAGMPCPVLDLRHGRGDGEALVCVPARMRRKHRMAWHRLRRHGGATLLRLHDRDLDWWLDELQRLHAARWRTRGEPGVLADPRLSGFHAEAMRRLAVAGLLRLHALQIGEAIAGIYYGFGDGRRSYAYLGGFDPSFASFSPGTVLLGAAISEGITEGAKEFHFLRGGEPYKYGWGAQDRWNVRLLIRRHPP